MSSYLVAAWLWVSFVSQDEMPVPMVPIAARDASGECDQSRPDCNCDDPDQDCVLKRGHGFVGPEKVAESP